MKLNWNWLLFWKNDKKKKTNISKRKITKRKKKLNTKGEKLFVTFEQHEPKLQGKGHSWHAKIKPCWIKGELKNWKSGTFMNRSGRRIFGLKVEYQPNHGSTSTMKRIIELPRQSRGIKLRTRKTIPVKFQSLLKAA